MKKGSNTPLRRSTAHLYGSTGTMDEREAGCDEHGGVII